MGILTNHQLSFIFGLLGNIVSFFVFLAPVPTFCDIYKKKSSAGYHSIPYVIALCSATLLLYYGNLKPNGFLIITINSIGCVIEVSYLIVYLIYAPRKEKKFTLTLILVLNVGAFGTVMLVSNFLLTGFKRISAVGWICAAYNLAEFVAPLSIMKKVITTKSVEFMSFSLSCSLTLCATMWFFYGLFIKDKFIALPNVVGISFGITQIIIYLIYCGSKNKNTETTSEKHPVQPDQEILEVKMIVIYKSVESIESDIV
ncbi:bidirectional sugar transporter SWEET9-like [Pistacia vera]|uniref:bidirectional sugar transporter SWEET9-like n=1 Tax=Pistacia vera TaxID=55513 RepID=UPI001263BB37|nr:bidirectional sugar transporter SWEET9-like [Pistacia vera]XP_031287862.1 bidirectional sugar transporter SWEET9-like [Pistacia vera]